MRQIKFLMLLNNLNKKNESKQEIWMHSKSKADVNLNERRNCDSAGILAKWLSIRKKNDAISAGCRRK